MWTRGWRDDVWNRLEEPWDIVIIGGGITGAGILAEAVRHGWRTLLVEAQDFSSGTSSRSTKLVHGGLRYLRQGHFLLTQKSLKEREKLMREGEGLVNNLSFSLAVFQGDVMPKWMYGMALGMYDALAGKWDHERQSKDEMVARVPALAGSGVIGGYRYNDAQTDDSRLVLRVLREAVAQGGTAINYARAESLLRTKNGRVCGVVVRDVAPSSTRAVEVQAKVVINATGAWADELRTQLGEDKRLRKIRGSHLTFSSARLPLGEAVSLVHPRDGRAVFAVPWEGATIFGTTDVDHGSLEHEPVIAAEETAYLFEALHRAFPKAELTEADVVSTWAGVRPVIDTGKADPSKESREYAIWDEHGLLTITGGKLTTFALMARDALTAAEERIGRLQPRARVLAELGFRPVWPTSLDDAMKLRLFGRFGAEAAAVAKDLSTQFGGIDGAARVEGSHYHYGEIAHAARSEGVVTLGDLMLRRVRLGLLLPRGGARELPKIRAIAQPLLNWDDGRWDAEVRAYEETVRQAYSPR